MEHACRWAKWKFKIICLYIRIAICTLTINICDALINFSDWVNEMLSRAGGE